MSPLDTQLFGSLHLSYLVLGVFLWVTVPWIGQRLEHSSWRKRVAIWIAILLVVQNLSEYLLRYMDGLYTITHDIPLHLCGLSLYLTAWALYSKNQGAFELAYFWGLAGASQSILTPDIAGMLNHTYVFMFFISHILIITGVLWLVFVDGMRCRKGSLPNTILVTNGLAFGVSIINGVLGANYMYLCEKPASESPLIMGEWPLYILGFQIFGFLLMGLVYLPMIIARRKNAIVPVT